MSTGWTFKDVENVENILVKANYEQLEYIIRAASRKLTERKIQQSLRAAQEIAYGF